MPLIEEGGGEIRKSSWRCEHKNCEIPDKLALNCKIDPISVHEVHDFTGKYWIRENIRMYDSRERSVIVKLLYCFNSHKIVRTFPRFPQDHNRLRIKHVFITERLSQKRGLACTFPVSISR